MPQQCRQAFSYERLENVGDSLLKFATCTALFSSYPSAHEGVLGPAELYLAKGKKPPPHPPKTTQKWRGQCRLQTPRRECPTFSRSRRIEADLLTTSLVEL